MKLATMLVVFAALCGNAVAQNATDETTAGQPGSEMTVDQCLADLERCRTTLDSTTTSSMDLLLELAERQGFASVNDMLAADCQSRRGTWNGSECLCAEPNHWFGTTEHPETCCVANVHGYENRMHSCAGSGGSYSCRGGCRCPMGTQLLDGECVGEAASREEIERLRARIPELEQQLTAAQSALETAQGNGETQADQISDLEDQLAAAQSALNELRDLLAVREQQLEDALGQLPPAPTVTPPAPLPGTAEAVAAAAGGTEPGPMAPVPPPEEEGNWCEENGWACAAIIIGAAAALTGATVGIVEATRDIPITQ